MHTQTAAYTVVQHAAQPNDPKHKQEGTPGLLSRTTPLHASCLSIDTLSRQEELEVCLTGVKQTRGGLAANECKQLKHKPSTSICHQIVQVSSESELIIRQQTAAQILS